MAGTSDREGSDPDVGDPGDGDPDLEDPDDGDSSDDEWAFGLDDVGPEAERHLEAGQPTREGVLFFLLGLVTALGVLWAMVP